MTKLLKMRQVEPDQMLRSFVDYVNGITPTQDMNMIEIGSYAGESTTVFCKWFNQVVSVDPFEEGYDPDDIACQNMPLGQVYDHFIENTYHITNLKHIRKRSDDAAKIFIGKDIHLVYIDGVHTYDQVKRDIQNYLPLILPGGFISGHDYNPYWTGVVNAVDELLGEPDQVFEDSSWIKQIK
jgi:hypothetical protein